MANFRRNHVRQKRGNSNFGSKLIMVIALMVFVVYLLLTKSGGEIADLFFTQNVERTLNTEENTLQSDFQDSRLYPSIAQGTLIEHNYFALSYVEQFEQPEWVAYKLTKNQLKAENVDRADYFVQDTSIHTASATYYDYKGSGFSRGHLVPSADRNFSREANDETFFMSNVSPQQRTFNNGIWKELEMSIRNWTYDREELYIVSGPLFGRFPQFIGSNNVAVPEAFYKIVYDIDTQESIAFIMPNQKSTESILQYVVSIDEIEKITSIDFFHLLSDSTESAFEANTKTEGWPEFKNLYHERITKWNKE